MKNLILLLTILVLFSVSTDVLYAETANTETLISNGSQYFTEGKYRQAADQYRQALQAGADNGHLLYNLANAEFRAKNFGRAIAFYRLAALKFPADPQIKNGLQSLIDEVQPPIIPAQQTYYSAGIFALQNYLSADKVKLLFLLSNCGLWLTLALSLRRNDRLLNSHSLGAVLIFCYLGVAALFVRPAVDGGFVLALSAESRAQHPAVVVSKNGAKVFAGTGEEFQVIYQMSEGTQFELKRKQRDWAEVQLPEQRKGWVRTKDLIVIES